MVKPSKAKKNHRISFIKNALDKFDYYSLVDPFADGYYKIGEKKCTRSSSQVNV
jgi:hypothetical protein